MDNRIPEGEISVILFLFWVCSRIEERLRWKKPADASHRSNVLEFNAAANRGQDHGKGGALAGPRGNPDLTAVFLDDPEGH